MWNINEMTEDQKAKLKQYRDRGYRSLKRLCILQLALATISFIVGIVTLAYSMANPAFPYIVAAPAWTAILVAIGAVCGFRAASMGLGRDDVPDKVKMFVIVHYVFNVLCITLCCLSAVGSVLGAAFCESYDVKVSVNCQPNKIPLMATSIVTAVTGFLLALFCIFGTCFFCCYARLLGFKSKYEYIADRRLKDMQRQIDELRAQGQPPPLYATHGHGQVQGQVGQVQGQVGQVQGQVGQGQLNAGYYNWEFK